MKAETDLANQSELGLIPTMRIFVVYWIAHWIVLPLFFILVFGAEGYFTGFQLSILVGIHVWSLVLLSWRVVQQWLRNWLLPIVILSASIPFFLERIWRILPLLQPLPELASKVSAVPLSDDFVLLTLIVAWQYRFRAVALYVLMITLLDTAISLPVRDIQMSAFFDMTIQIIFRCVIYLLLGFVVTRLRGINRKQRQDLMEAHEEQVAANQKLTQHAATVEQLTVSQERNRLARELHDTLAHSLSAIAVQLQAIGSLWDVNPQRAQTILVQAEKSADDGLIEARRALQALRAAPLEEFGLTISLRELAESAAERADLAVEIELPDLTVPLADHVEQNVYRVLQEALENVVRHARARHLTVQMKQHAYHLTFLVADDGLGFDPAESNAQMRQMGLRGMRERAELIGSRLTIESQLQRGTQIRLTVMLDSGAEEISVV
ncbi:MAG: sensor histidine kinase [Chloroflexota bacterium]